MSVIAPLVRIPVGVIVERRKAESPWVDYLWSAATILTGIPDTPVWTQVSSEDDVATFYVGSTDIDLYRSEAGNYRVNLAGDAGLWVVLRPTGGEPPYDLFTVTADPGEGEAYTQVGDDLVDCLPMPQAIREIVEAFVAEHHVEEQFVKRERKRLDPDALGRRSLLDEDD